MKAILHYKGSEYLDEMLEKPTPSDATTFLDFLLKHAKGWTDNKDYQFSISQVVSFVLLPQNNVFTFRDYFRRNSTNPVVQAVLTELLRYVLGICSH
jgi:hypothetical protein